MRMIPILETKRLLIRPFVMEDLETIHRILDVCFDDSSHVNDATALAERREWLQWQTLNHVQLAKLSQPPYGDRAIVLKESGALIGSIGVVPCLDVYEQLPVFGDLRDAKATNEMGLFWAIDPAYQGKGYASEAARILIQHLFTAHNLKRIIATTEYDNVASQGVMQKVGMLLERNPLPEPPWLQVVGVLENTA